ncbi:hypothetical protein NUU61_008689 [Penicillium alfredii]|uniref:DUF4396 domain-containing protein n=1 Tax=Penicillium alfredii TaxID=1506179 RepID=A0A9W9ELU4_9EURO|nr:uncharacterized protein NUU61_008689 [Penicillium alfredii]KAJ5084110.1 hypothetical protein NUU61_008689 [Penicillium alfredii]
MNRPCLGLRPVRLSWSARLFATTSTTRNRQSTQPKQLVSEREDASSKKRTVVNVAKAQLSILHRSFWACRSTWKRARINTLRCLLGCSIGDFSALWMLQTFCPDMGVGSMMAVSMASGITSSIILETVLLRHGKDRLPWPIAARTAMGMNLVSMLAMEAAENTVDFHLTGGVVVLADSGFWLAAAVSVGAGFLVPLPYNYARLRKYGKACH